MSDAVGLQTRSPADVGYLPWVLHRLSALVLVVLLGLHVGVQLYGVARPGFYGGLLDLTLGLVLLHGFLGVRATVLETSLSRGLRTALVWAVGLLALALFLLRVLG